ncbi:MAG: mechanosensitive ion channel family protein [Methanoregula sp.]|nr:mechanosensitive ion channel family protein [Methanoregula sp.]
MEIPISDLNFAYAAATVVIGVLIALVTRVAVNWLKTKAGETETNWDDIIIAAIGTPVQITIIIVAIYLAISQFNILPSTWLWLLDPRLVSTFYIVIGAWIISSFLHDIIAVYGHELAEQSEGDWDDRLVELLELVVKYIVWFAAIMLILSIFKVDIAPFLAGAGIAGLAVALAAQDLISNFFGGAIITVDKPFKIGDRIKVDQYYGDVMSIGPRSTRLKTLDYQIVTIPNNKITTNIIVNYAEPDQKLRITIPVSVAYGSNPKRVKEILLEIAHNTIKKTEYLLEEPAPKTFFVEFEDSSLKFILYVWARKYNLPDEVKDVLNTQIAERFAAEGIEIPFPQMEVRLKK